MARSIQDVTTIYRFKTTHNWTAHRDGYGHKKGDELTEVSFIGPYSRKIPWAGWTPSSGTFKVERQQLRAVPGPEMIDANTPEELALEWQTIETKYYEPETDDDA